MKIITLTQGYETLIDDSDFEAVSKFKWCAHRVGNNVYAAHNTLNSDGTRGLQHLHRFLLPNAPEIDHKDGNGLNNCRKNLRPASRAQNARAFCQKRLRTSSKFRGVSWCRVKNRWRAVIKKDYKYHQIGYYSDESEAARAYDDAARRLFGVEFCNPNFPI